MFFLSKLKFNMKFSYLNVYLKRIFSSYLIVAGNASRAMVRRITNLDYNDKWNRPFWWVTLAEMKSALQEQSSNWSE